jgi:hypothetical protein
MTSHTTAHRGVAVLDDAVVAGRTIRRSAPLVQDTDFVEPRSALDAAAGHAAVTSEPVPFSPSSGLMASPNAGPSIID